MQGELRYPGLCSWNFGTMQERRDIWVCVALQVLMPNGRRQKPFKSCRLVDITGDIQTAMAGFIGRRVKPPYHLTLALVSSRNSSWFGLW